MIEKKDLLLEIGTEDLPARLVYKLAAEFADLLSKEFTANHLNFTNHEVYCSPRRIALVVNSLDYKQEDQQTERKGPHAASAFDAEGAPTQAAIGFAKSCGVEVDELIFEKDAEEPRLIFHQQKAGLETTALLQDMLDKSMKKLSIPKRMRWNTSDAEFIRPVRWLLGIFGSEVLTISLFGQNASNISYGHRFHHPKEIIVKHASAYRELLEVKGHVLVDYAQRQESIIKQVEVLAEQENAMPAYSAELLDEVTNLVESPHAILGSFDTKFLDIHQEVLISTMQDNQKYIPLLNHDGELLAKFIIISNINSKSPEVVRHGNEKVIVPRFEDALFFWERDKKISLASRLDQLKKVVFEKQLGSLFDKTERIEKLAIYLSTYTGANKTYCARAANLSKCDLITETVGEFPKLQGTIGRNLASHHVEDQQVALALEEQYLPRYAGDSLPTSPVGQAIALADRLDSLIGIFAIGKKPTGLKDPYALRRASLAVLRIMIEGELDLDLLACLNEAALSYPNSLDTHAAIDDVFDYMMERLRGYLIDQHYTTDVIDAVLANRPSSPKDIKSRIDAVCSFRKIPDAENLAAANKRIRNILKKVNAKEIQQINTTIFNADAEKVLHSNVEKLSKQVEELFKQRDYEKALTNLATLQQPIDTFFDDVMVMDKDEALKNNRIALLASIDNLFMHVADLSKLST